MRIEYKGTRIYAFSDTHGMHHKLEIPVDTDILICAGDAVEDNLAPADYTNFLDWFESQPGDLKIFVPGNHELTFDVAPKWGEILFMDRNIILGYNKYINHKGISFYCLGGMQIPDEAVDVINQSDFLVCHYPPEMLVSDFYINPRFLICGHDHSRSDVIGYGIDHIIYSVCKYETLINQP